MKLYYSAGSCSTSCHITLEESGLKYEAISVDWSNPSDPSLKIVEQLNPMGTLPILVTDQGKVLNQNLAIHGYVADLAPSAKLLPPSGTIERAEAMNWLSFVAADYHKSFSPLFGLGAFEDERAKKAVRDLSVASVNQCFALLDQHLAGKQFILGSQFSVIDAYCFVVTGWGQFLEVPIASYKNLSSYIGRVAARPAVHKVMKEEGLLE
jgi:glutathione S-transferase